VDWIGTSTRTAQLNNSSVGLGHQHDQLKPLQMIGPVGLGHRFGSPPLCSTTDASHHNKNQSLSSPPLKGDSTTYFFYQHQPQRKKEKERTRETLSPKPPKPQHLKTSKKAPCRNQVRDRRCTTSSSRRA
jgi:hypothetical protein